jgi:hypothetical protein
LNYVDKDEILAEAMDLSARRKLDKLAPMSDKMARMIMLICDNVMNLHKFQTALKNMPWVRDELVSEALCNIVQRAGNFDPNIKKNAFSFFTSCVYFSFIIALKRERKNMLIKMTAYRQNLSALEYDELKSEFGEDIARAIMKDLEKPEKKSAFIGQGGTLTARRNRFKRKPLSDLWERNLSDLWDMELWID